MDELIEALQIFRKYTDKKFPTACEHDVLYVAVDPHEVSEEDRKRLKELGFLNNLDPDEDVNDGEADEDANNFFSYTFGSC